MVRPANPGVNCKITERAASLAVARRVGGSGSSEEENFTVSITLLVIEKILFLITLLYLHHLCYRTSEVLTLC